MPTLAVGMLRWFAHDKHAHDQRGHGTVNHDENYFSIFRAVI
jgi:hypothetical protein